MGPGGLGSFVGATGERTGELLLQALTDNPFAGREVLLGLDQLDLLLGSHLDGDGRGRFLATVTDPSRFLRSETLPILTRVLGYLGDHRDVTVSTVSRRDLDYWLGAIVGPWLLEVDLDVGRAAGTVRARRCRGLDRRAARRGPRPGALDR